MHYSGHSADFGIRRGLRVPVIRWGWTVLAIRQGLTVLAIQQGLTVLEMVLGSKMDARREEALTGSESIPRPSLADGRIRYGYQRAVRAAVMTTGWQLSPGNSVLHSNYRSPLLVLYSLLCLFYVLCIMHERSRKLKCV